jgi:hypothetical protein
MNRVVRHGILVFGLAAACGGESIVEMAPEKVTTDSGSSTPAALTTVRGGVRLREGGCMPPTTPETCRVRPLSTVVAAYDVLRVIHSERGTTFPDPSTGVLRASTTSALDGTFDLRLPPGRYTIIAEYQGQWWPHSWTSTDDAWAGIDVGPNGVMDIDLLVNLAAD